MVSSRQAQSPLRVSAAPLPFFTTLERNSVDSTGVEGNLASRNAGSSADGRFIAFQSDANNLVPNDNNNTSDIFVKDRTNGSIERVSVGDGGVESNGFSSTFSAPGLSDDGRFVAFASEASNLVPNDNNGASDVFVFDRTNDTIELVSRATGGAQGDRTSDSPSISADGRFVTFRSQSTNFAPGVNVQNDHHIFVFDRNSDTIQRISQEANGTIGNSFNSQPTISADGRFVAFSSAATNLVANDTNGAVQDVFVYDRTNNVMDLVSVDNGGTQGNSGSNQPDISVDGRFVTFGSFATNLVADDTTSNLEAFVRDRTNNTTERVALGPAGVEANAGSSASQISDDGRFVIFFSTATNLVTIDTSSFGGLFIRDRDTDAIELLSRTVSGGDADNFIGEAVEISDDGSRVIFSSLATNMVPNDGNNVQDVFTVANPFRR